MPIRSLVLIVAAALAVLTFGGDKGDRIELAAGIAGGPGLVVTPMNDENPPPPPMERRVNIEMKDHFFAPSSFEVAVGETVTFVFTNRGQAVHDAFIGDRSAQDKHEEEMRRNDGSPEHAHEGGVTVSPGKTGALRYVFDKPGTLEIGCHRKGHYINGMRAVIDVVSNSPSRAQTAVNVQQADPKITIAPQAGDRYIYDPAQLDVRVGQPITITNSDPVGVHSVTAEDRTFNVEVPPKSSVTLTVPKAGLFPYYCTYHPDQHNPASINVS